jgi:hypothetical protein
LARIADADRVAKRLQMMTEIATRYADAPQFLGWSGRTKPTCRLISPTTYPARQRMHPRSARLTPQAKTLTAPYGTYQAVNDDRYVRQLDQLEVDIIAYQDEVGCLRMTPEQSAAAFARLRRAHDRVPQRALWADVETFAWEGPPNKQTSPLIPAPFERLRAQLEAVSPYVDKVLIYQYQGLMNKPGSPAFAGILARQSCTRITWLVAPGPARPGTDRSAAFSS